MFVDRKIFEIIIILPLPFFFLIRLVINPTVNLVASASHFYHGNINIITSTAEMHFPSLTAISRKYLFKIPLLPSFHSVPSWKWTKSWRVNIYDLRARVTLLPLWDRCNHTAGYTLLFNIALSTPCQIRSNLLLLRLARWKLNSRQPASLCFRIKRLRLRHRLTISNSWRNSL